MVNDVVAYTNYNLKKYNPKTINDIYKQKNFIVGFSPKMKLLDKKIKEFLRKNMYNNKKVLINTNRGKKIIKGLFMKLSKNPKKYISYDLLKSDKAICL